MTNNYLSSAIKQFGYYKILGEKTFAQLPDDKLFWQYNGEGNSIATLSTGSWHITPIILDRLYLLGK